MTKYSSRSALASVDQTTGTIVDAVGTLPNNTSHASFHYIRFDANDWNTIINVDIDTIAMLTYNTLGLSSCFYAGKFVSYIPTVDTHPVVVGRVAAASTAASSAVSHTLFEPNAFGTVSGGQFTYGVPTWSSPYAVNIPGNNSSSTADYSYYGISGKPVGTLNIIKGQLSATAGSPFRGYLRLLTAGFTNHFILGDTATIDGKTYEVGHTFSGTAVMLRTA